MIPYNKFILKYGSSLIKSGNEIISYQIPTPYPTDGLIAFWQWEDNLNSTTSRDIELSVDETGGSGFFSYVTGKVEKAIHNSALSASSEYAYLITHDSSIVNSGAPVNSIWENAGFNPFTIITWFKHTTSQNLTDLWHFFSDEFGGTNELSLQVNGSAGTIRIRGTDITNLISGSGYSDDNWHLAITKYDASTFSLKIDDVSIGTTTYTGPVNYDPSVFRIASGYSLSTNNYNGNMDQFMIYNRALSEVEDNIIWNSGFGR